MQVTSSMKESSMTPWQSLAELCWRKQAPVNSLAMLGGTLVGKVRDWRHCDKKRMQSHSKPRES